MFIIHHSNTRGEKRFFVVVVVSLSILDSSKIVYLQVDWFTGYNGIMITH